MICMELADKILEGFVVTRLCYVKKNVCVMNKHINLCRKTNIKYQMEIIEKISMAIDMYI